MFIIEEIISIIKTIAIFSILSPILIYITVAIINIFKSSSHSKNQKSKKKDDLSISDDVWHVDVDIEDIKKNRVSSSHQGNPQLKVDVSFEQGGTSRNNKSVLYSTPIFIGFDNNIHEQSQQLSRMRSADSPFMYIAEISNDKNTATIVGDSGETYTTTFSNCTCKDFQERHLPCKHMYKLAFYTGHMKPEDWYEGYDFQNKNIVPSQISVDFNGHNMSMNQYKIRSIFKETNHVRTVYINAFSENDAIEHIGSEYELPPKSIEIEDYPSPTERQIIYAIYLGIDLPAKCCQYDLSALLGNDNSIPAPHALQQFAIKERILFSLYSDEPSLIETLFKHYEKYSVEQVAFLIAYISNIKTGNWSFYKWDNYIQYGKECLTNSSFVNSFKRIYSSFSMNLYLSPKTLLYQTLSKYLDEN